MLPDINTLLKPRPKKYRNLVKHIRRDLAFQDSESLSLTQEELFNDLTTSRGTSRFMGVFSTRGIEFTLRKFGYFEHLENVGLSEPIINLDTSDSYKHRVQISHQIGKKLLLSGEIVMRRSTFKSPPLDEREYPPADLLVVEWFLLHNPLKKFARRRPQLPGQDYPGLGISSIIFEIFFWMAKRLRTDGVVIVPNYLHTGLFYGRRFMFINPRKQGTLFALDKMRNAKISLNQLSWACSEGQLIDRNLNSVFLWKPAPMVLPVSRLAREYFGSEIYINKAKSSQNKLDLKINRGYKKQFNSKWEAIS
ncbi:MAG: hypothetical protein MUP82_08725 [Candidatus Marinimicrobia bacterium]|nr:hypothetical protein [Candidatus Neomarinimicrobiota bacterium]